MDGKTKKTSARFPLRLPDDIDAQVREIARGDSDHPPTGINETILFLIKDGLKRRRERQASENVGAGDYDR